jgi:hypothetical protein
VEFLKLNVGDRIVSLGIVREITAVRETGYTWRYPDKPDKDFLSENSNDPFFDLGWVLADKCFDDK